MKYDITNLDLVNIKAYIRFGEEISICSQDIKGKQKSDINHGSYLFYKFALMTGNNPNLVLVNINAHTNVNTFYHFVLKMLIPRQRF